ncbi:MAG: hypothetical protein R6V60_06290 [Desulfobacterales bacterium]
MIVDWLSKPIVWAAGLSFCIGAFGYVLLCRMLWPLLGYRALKSRIRRVIDSPEGGGTPERKALLRQYAAELTASYSQRLPVWYRLALKRRNEAPLEAVRHLMALANATAAQPADRRRLEVRRALGLTNQGKR